MRLAYLCADRGVPVAGTKGASVHVRAVANALERRGHHVSVLAASSDGADQLDLEVINVGFDRQLKRVRRKLATDTGNRALAGEVYAMLLNGRVRRQLERLHEDSPIEAVYERYSLWSWEGLRFAREHRIPMVLEVNAPLIEEQAAYRSIELPSVARAIAREVVTGADFVVVPAPELVDYLHSEFGRREPTVVVPNGVDVELFRHPQSPSGGASVPTSGSPVIAFVGSLKPWHGVELLLEAFRYLLDRCAEARLLIVGDGPQRRVVDQAAASWGRERIHCTGAVEHDEVPSWLALADVGVAPYPDLERFYFSPLKVIEYMAAGLPVVASRLGQLCETVEHGRTGLLIDPGDAGALGRALVELSKDPDTRTAMGERARRRAFERYSWDQAVNRIEQLLTHGIGEDRESESRPAADRPEVPLWA